MSIRINIGATFDAKDIKAARREIDALERQLEEAATGFASVNRRLRNFSQGAFSVGSALTSSVTVPILGAGGAAVTAAANFSESMSKITALVGIAAGEVQGMEESVLALSRETAKAPGELADALFVVTSAGLRGQAALDALEVSAKASAAGLGTTADIARSVAGAINAYGEDTLDAARATDIVVATARAGNFETTQFAAALGRVLPFAQQAEASLEDVGGAVALLTRTNGNAAESITAIQALFRAFVVPTEEAKKILDEVGLSAADLRTQMGQEGLVSTLRTLDGALGGNREVLGRLLSSTEAASAAFQILNADADTIAGTFGVVGDSAGITGDAFETAADESAFTFRQALNDLQLVAIDLGNELLPVVTDITERLRDLVGEFNELSDEQQDNILKMAGFAAVAGPLAITIGAVTTAVRGLAGALAFLFANPMVAGLTLLAGAIGLSVFNYSMMSEAEKEAAREARQANASVRQNARASAYLAENAANAAREQGRQATASRYAGLAAAYAAGEVDHLAGAGRKADYTTVRLGAEMERAQAAAAALADAVGGDGGDPGVTETIVVLSEEMREALQEINLLGNGMENGGEYVAQFARELLAAGRITKETSQAAVQLAQVVKQDVDKALQDANRRLDDATERFNSYKQAIADGVSQGNTLADAASAQSEALRDLATAEQEYEAAIASGDPDRIADAADQLSKAQDAQGSFTDFLSTGLSTAQGFADQIDALRLAGASMAVVQEIAELGAKTGGRIAAELLAGGADAIAQANRLVDATERAAQRAGQAAAQQFYGAGVESARQFVAAVEASIPALQSVLDRIADMIESALGERPDVNITGEQGPFIPPQTGEVVIEPTNGGGGGGRSARPQPAEQGRLLVPGTFLAEGGLVTAPTFGVIGEAGPELVIPLDRLGGMGGSTVVNVTVTSADPQSVVEAIRRYTRNNGPLGGVVSL